MEHHEQPWISRRQAGNNVTSWQAAERFREYDFDVYLDVGCGKHPEHHKIINRPVKTTDMFPPADYVGDYVETDCGGPWSAIWCSHVLEHQHDVHHFLIKMREDLAENGVLCITVPPAHGEFMGGHVSLWNEGMLCYRLILARFDCSQARVGVYDRNITVILRKRTIPCEALDGLVHDKGDIEQLAPYFPVSNLKQGSPMRFGNVRW
jgi:hypothetical protein